MVPAFYWPVFLAKFFLYRYETGKNRRTPCEIPNDILNYNFCHAWSDSMNKMFSSCTSILFDSVSVFLVLDGEWAWSCVAVGVTFRCVFQFGRFNYLYLHLWSPLGSITGGHTIDFYRNTEALRFHKLNRLE